MNETTTDLKDVVSDKTSQVVKHKNEPKSKLNSKERSFYKNVSSELLADTSNIIEQQIDAIRVLDKMRHVFTGTVDTIKNFASKAFDVVTNVLHLPKGPLEWFNKILSFILLIEGLFIVFKTNFGEKIRKGLSSITDALWGSI